MPNGDWPIAARSVNKEQSGEFNYQTGFFPSLAHGGLLGRLTWFHCPTRQHPVLSVRGAVPAEQDSISLRQHHLCSHHTLPAI